MHATGVKWVFSFSVSYFVSLKNSSNSDVTLPLCGKDTLTLLDVSNFQFILLDVQIKNPYLQFIACEHFLHLTITIIVFMPKKTRLALGEQGRKEAEAVGGTQL